MRSVFKNSIEKGMYRYIKERSKYGMNFKQEEESINEGLKFIRNPENIEEHKAIIFSFLWDVWSGFFPKVEKREEVYEEMHKQVLQIIECIWPYIQYPVLSSSVRSLLGKFNLFYSKKDLPSEFKNAPSYLKIVDVLNSLLK